MPKKSFVNQFVEPGKQAKKVKRFYRCLQISLAATVICCNSVYAISNSLVLAGVVKTRSETKSHFSASQNDFDIKHYDINVRLDIPDKSIAGTVTIKSLAVAKNLKEISLDLSNDMAVDSIRSSGRSLTFTHQDDLLNINLGQTYKAGDSFEVTVDYKGKQEGIPASGFFLSRIYRLL